MEKCIPKFWERGREWKIAFPSFGNGNEKLIPKLWERESEARIPKNGREREFPLTPGISTENVSDFAKQLLHLIKMFAIVKEGGRSREEEGTACVG